MSLLIATQLAACSSIPDRAATVNLDGLWIAREFPCAEGKRDLQLSLKQQERRLRAYAAADNSCAAIGALVLHGELPAETLALEELPLTVRAELALPVERSVAITVLSADRIVMLLDDNSFRLQRGMLSKQPDEPTADDGGRGGGGGSTPSMDETPPKGGNGGAGAMSPPPSGSGAAGVDKPASGSGGHGGMSAPPKGGAGGVSGAGTGGARAGNGGTGGVSGAGTGGARAGNGGAGNSGGAGAIAPSPHGGAVAPPVPPRAGAIATIPPRVEGGTSGGAPAGRGGAGAAGRGGSNAGGPPEPDLDALGLKWDCLTIFNSCSCIAYPPEEVDHTECAQKYPCCYTDTADEQPKCICNPEEPRGGCFVYSEGSTRRAVDWCPGQS